MRRFMRMYLYSLNPKDFRTTGHLFVLLIEYKVIIFEENANLSGIHYE